MHCQRRGRHLLRLAVAQARALGAARHICRYAALFTNGAPTMQQLMWLRCTSLVLLVLSCIALTCWMIYHLISPRRLEQM